MTPTEKGAFCQKCAAEVYDFTHKSNEEIKQTLRSLIGQPVCGKITLSQEATLNAEFDAWLFQSKRSFQSKLVLSLIVVFGLTLFSCSHEDKAIIEAVQASAMHAMQDQAGKTPVVPVAEMPVNTIQIPEAGEIAYPEMEYVEPMDIELDEVAVHGSDYDVRVVGAMVSTRAYTEFLTSTVTPPVELDENGVPYPTVFAALVYPNPVMTETTFKLDVPVENQFGINLYDLNGKFIQSIHSGTIPRGTFRQTIDLGNQPAGIYLVTIYSRDFKETVRISKI